MRGFVALAAMVAVAAVAFGVVVGVGALQGGEDHPRIPYPVDAIQADRQLPRFKGDILGVHIDPPDDTSEEEYERLCGLGVPTVAAPWEQAGELNLSFNLPPVFILDENSMDQGVAACGSNSKVFAARWDYRIVQPDGWPARLLIARTLFARAVFDAATTRVKTTEIGGRQAVLIEPVTPDGRGSGSGVVFPESFGMTVLTATDLPLEQLLAAATIVAESSR